MFKNLCFSAKCCFISVLTLAIFGAGLISCEVGLGAAVDVQTPVAAVEAPAANDIIRQKFTMSGSWEDDGEIQSISVVLENTSSKETYGPFAAQLNADKSEWNVEINPLGDSAIPDGKYNSTIEIKDTYGHSSKTTVAFTIDNTPPVVILSRPATRKDVVSPDAYGCDFMLEGEAIDDNVISLIEVEIYDAATNELKTTVPLENVAKKIERSVAVFGAADGAYEKIYGELEKLEDATKKRFYCKVFAYDEAKKVPADPNDAKGNRTEIFFLESEVSKYTREYKSSGFYEIYKGTYVPSERSVNTYSVEDVKAAFESQKITEASFSLDPRNNPKYTVSSRSNISEMNSDLTTDAGKLSNNSTVTVNFERGLDNDNLVKDTIGVYLMECDSTGKILEDASEIMLFPPYKDKAGNVLKDADGNPLESDPANRDARFNTSGSTYSVNVKIGTKTESRLKVAKFYRFVVKGFDEAGNEIKNYADTDYAFKLASVNAIPSITISALERKSASGTKTEANTNSANLAAGEKLVIKGTATLEELIPNLKFSIGLSTDLSGSDTDLGTLSAADFPSGFECTIPENYKNSKFLIRILAINPEEPDQTSSEKVQVIYDCEGPEFGTFTITPTVKKEAGGVEKEFVNGTVKIKTSVNDRMNVVEKVEYTVKKAGGAESVRVSKVADEKTGNLVEVKDVISGSGIRIDTTAWDDDSTKTGKAVVTIYAADEAGNISSTTVDLEIDQSTDQPVIEFTTADPSIKDIEGIKAASERNTTNNIFQINGANNYIGGTVTDDDGVASISIFKRKAGETEWKEEKILEGGKTTAYTFKNVVSKIQGEYDVYLVVTDTAGEETGYKMNRLEPFFVGVDEGSPNFMITSTQGLQAQNTALVVSGTVNDGTEVTIDRFVYTNAASFEEGKRYFTYISETGVYQEADTTGWKALPDDGKTYFYRQKDPYTEGPAGEETYKFNTITIPVGTTSWSDTIPAAEVGTTGATIYYEATDKYGQTTGQNYMYTIDNQSPLFKITDVNTVVSPALEGAVAAAARTKVFVKAEAGKYLTIKGTAEDVDANDPTKSRGLDEFAYYKLIEASSALSEENLVNGAFDISGWNQTKKIESGVWQQTIDLGEASLSNGTSYILYVAVKDAAGNISKVSENPCSAVYIIPDSTEPVISNPVYKIGNTTIRPDDAIQINTANKDKEIILSAKIEDVSPGTPSGIQKVELLENNVAYAFTKTITNSDSAYTVKIKAEELATGTHILVLRATDNVGNYRDFTWKEISVDVTNPSDPLITGITPYVTDESDNTVYNGTINIKVSASDETALDKVIWWVTNEAGAVKLIPDTNIECLGTTSKNATITIATDTALTQTNGTYKFFVKAIDKGGNESQPVSEILKIDQATDQPVITLTNAEAGITSLEGMKAAVLAGTTDNIFGSRTDNELNFTVTDDDGIASVIVTDSSKADPVKVYEYPSGQYQKTLKLSYTLPSEKNLYDIKIDVTDCKAETTTYKANTTGTFKVAVDDEKPVISNVRTSIDAKLKNNVLYANDDFTITLDVQDDYKLDSLTYVENTDAAKSVTVTADATKQTKTISISKRGTAGAADAQRVTNVITLKDAFGRYRQEELTYVFDLKAPEFSGISYTLLNNNYMDATKTFSVTGTVSDNGTNQSGVNDIKFAVAKGNVSSFPATETTENTFKSWTDVSGTAAGWTAKLDAGEITAEGDYTLFIKATDLAGNETVSDPIPFTADTAAPVSTISTPDTYYNKSKDGTDVEISGTLTETHLKSWKLELNGTDVTASETVTGPTTANGNKWSVRIPVKADGTNDGVYTVKATFTDYVNKTGSSETVTTTIDTTPLVIADITSDLVNTNYMDAEKTFSVKGKVNNPGNGASEVDSIQFAVVKGNVTEYPSLAADVLKDWAEVSGKAAGWTAKLDAGEITSDNVTADGKYTLFIRAYDLAGNESEIKNVQFIADTDVPASTVSEVQKNYGASASNVTITGKLTEKFFKAMDVTVNGLTTGFTKNDPDANGDWSVVLPVDAEGHTKDGAYSISIKFTDMSGRAPTVLPLISTRIDTKAPELAPAYRKGSGAGSASVGTSAAWSNETNVYVFPNVTDTDGSGIKSVQYKVFDSQRTLDQLANKATGTDAEKNVSESDWGDETIAEGGFKNITFSEGDNYLYLRAEDNAGNVSFSSYYQRKADAKEPSIILRTPGAVRLVNGQNDIDVSKFGIEVSDNSAAAGKNSGIKQVDIYKGSIADGNLIASSAGSTKKTLTVSGTSVTGTIAKSEFSSETDNFDIYVQVTDNAGNKSSRNTQIGVDTTAPEVSITTRAQMKSETEYVGNKDLVIEGTSYDINGIESIKLEYQTGDSTWKDVTDADGFALTNQGEVTSWKFTIPTYDATSKATTAKLAFDSDAEKAGLQTKFRVTARDSALNPKTAELVVTIDQDSDRPVISFVSLSKDGDIVGDAKINGSISDDDGTTGLLFKINGTEVTVGSNGSFEYTPAEAGDGTKAMSFYIKDAAGTVFETTEGNALDRGKIKFNGQTEVDNKAVISYTVDSQKPFITSLKVGSDEMKIDVVKGGPSADNKKIRISVTAVDANGTADTATATINGTTYPLTGTSTKLASAKPGKDFGSTNSPDVEIPAGYWETVYTSEEIDVGEWTSGQVTVKFDVEDKAKQSSTATGYFIVDNAGPTIKHSNASSFNKEVTGSIKFDMEFADKPNDNNSGLSKYSYVVLNDTFYTKNEETNVWYIDETKLLAELKKAANLKDCAASIENLVIEGLPSVAQSSDDSIFKRITTIRDDVYQLPVYFYAVDTLGNYTLSSFTIKYDLFGSRPSSSVAYPAGTSFDAGKRQKMNGTIRVSGGAEKGSAEGAAEVEKVFVQFDVTKGTDFSTTDRDYVAAFKITGTETSIYNIVDAAKLEESISGIDWDGLGGESNKGNFWGIEVTGTSNWHQTINEYLEFQQSFNEETEGNGVYLVAARSVALSEGKIFGSWSPVQYFDIDTNIPIVNKEPAQIVSSEGVAIDYVEDMYVRGTAKLKVAVADSDGIAKVLVYRSNTLEGLNTTKDITTVDLSALTKVEKGAAGGFGAEYEGYRVLIDLPAPADNKEEVYLKVVASKQNQSSAYKEYHINFDNTVPEIKKLTFNSAEYSATENSSKRIMNSNRKFAIGGQAKDMGSGFEKAGFYFIRGNVENVTKYSARLYDPMANEKVIPVKAKGASTLSVDAKNFGEDESSLGSSVQPMYGKSYDGVTFAEIDYAVSAEKTEKRTQLTLSDDVNENIKNAGYVEVENTFYKIAAVDSENKKITLETNVSVLKGTTKNGVFFPFMQFVDNTQTERVKEEDPLALRDNDSGDDGDGMPETIVKSQQTWDWDATIQSQNIPDGPGTIVVFVWDKAGNISAASYPVSVQNNAPRLAKLYLGTDLDGDNHYDDDEFTLYNILGKEGIEKDTLVMNTYDYQKEKFIVKNGLALVTEFTGGNFKVSDDYTNPTLKAKFKNAATATEDKCTKATEDDQSDLDAPNGDILLEGSIKTAYDAEGSNMYAFNYPEDKLRPDGNNKKMSWTFWDVTEDTTQGIDSCYMYLRIEDLVVDQTDTTPPEMKIRPFYWNSKENSSVPLDMETEKPQGHIDFAATQTRSTKPSVSGKVYIEGTAHDNTRHGGLFMVDPAGNSAKVAEYKGGKWIVAHREGSSLVYEYMDGTAVAVADKPESDWEWQNNWERFEILEAGKPGQKGHDATWRFTIDMTGYGIGNDKVVTCYGVDAAGRTETANAEQTTDAVETRTNKYIMDFVPYISSFRLENDEEISRSRLGRYPVQAGAKVRVYGYNFASGASYKVSFFNTTEGKQAATANSDLGTQTGTIGTTDGSGDGYITITAPDYSCFVQVEITQGPEGSTVTKATQNNTNENKGWNIEEGSSTAYKTNGKNFWTDDRYLSVWKVDTQIEGSTNSKSGVVKKLTDDNLWRKKNDGSVSDWTGMAGSYMSLWGSPDLQIYGDVQGTSISKAPTMFANSQAAFNAEIQQLDYVVINGLPWYVFHDNWVKGNSANCWGAGLCIGREGFWWSKTDMGGGNSENSFDASNYKNIIERQGASTAADARNSSQGLDTVLNQFANPRIAGYNDGVNDIIYVSYYDTYARCLKYAAYRGTHTKANASGKWGTDDNTLTPLMRTAEHMTDGKAVVAGWDTLQTGVSVFKEEAGEWNDILIDPKDNMPVIVYYNMTKGSLEVAHAKQQAPVTGNICTTAGVANADTTEGTTGWYKTKNIRPAGTTDFGRYCSATVDSNGNIYVSAQDAANGKLYYIFLEKKVENNVIKYSPSYTLVDATSSVGRWTDIELDSAGKPVISYMDTGFLSTTKAMKVAYWDTKAQAFEAMTEPAKYQANDQRTSVMANVLEAKGSSNTSHVAVGFNSSMYAVDFLRGEK